MHKILEIINNLNLVQVQVTSIMDNESHYVLTLRGGLNGPGTWKMYLQQLTAIVDAFEEAYIIDCDYDCVDDLWYVNLGISK